MDNDVQGRKMAESEKSSAPGKMSCLRNSTVAGVAGAGVGWLKCKENEKGETKRKRTFNLLPLYRAQFPNLIVGSYHPEDLLDHRCWASPPEFPIQ